VFLLLILALQLYTVSVVIGMDAELDESSVDNTSHTEDRIVSQWREFSAHKKHELRDQVDEILRPLCSETSLLVIRRANSLALYFICMTLAAVMSLRHQWNSGQLSDIVQSLFTLLSGAAHTVRVKRLTWSLTDFQRGLEFFNLLQGKKMI